MATSVRFISNDAVELGDVSESRSSVINPLQELGRQSSSHKSSIILNPSLNQPLQDNSTLFSEILIKSDPLPTVITWWDHSFPFRLIAVSLCFAWTYLMIPIENYWVYNLVKQQLWAFLSVLSYVELQDICLPDLPDDLYIACYFIGFWTPVLVNIIAYLFHPDSYSDVQIFAVTSGIVFVLLLYGIHSIYRPHGEHYGQELSFQTAIIEHDKAGRHHWLDIMLQNDLTGTLYDTYTACMLDEEEDNSLDDSINIQSPQQLSESTSNETSKVDDSISEGRKNWAKVRGSFLRRMFKNQSNITEFDPPLFSWDKLGVFQKLCSYLPRFQYRRMKLSTGIVFGDRRVQWLYASLFNILFNGFFYFLALFTKYFREHGNDDNVIVLFFFFVLGSTLLRGSLKRTALVLDRRKIGSISMFFIAEFMGLMFYYTYYRLLFESITSWYLFFGFQGVHLLSEWMLYPMRCSRWLSKQMLELQKICPCLKGVFIPKRTNYSDWVQFVALDFSLRVVVMICSAIGILVLTLTIDYVPWVESDLKQYGKDIAWSSGYISVAVGLEVINALVINRLFFAPLHVDMWKKVRVFFTQPRVIVLAWVIATDLFINPMYSFTSDNSQFQS